MKRIPVMELLGCAFKQWAIGRGPRLEDRALPSLRSQHVIVLDLQKKHGKTLLPLRELHFMTGGAFPYSCELAKAIDLMEQSGMLISLIDPRGGSWFIPNVHSDTEQHLKEWRAKTFRDDPKACQAFLVFSQELGDTLKASGPLPFYLQRLLQP